MKNSHSFRPMKKNSLLLSMAMLCVAGATAHAAVLVTSSVQLGSAHNYTVSSTDLINGLAASASTGDFEREGSAGLTALNNGSFPTFVSANPIIASGGDNAGTSVTFTLPTAVSIASIDVYGGWTDPGRDQQHFSVWYAIDSAPATFIFLTTVNFQPSETGGTQATRSSITEDSTGVLAQDVKALRFDFNVVENGWSGYSEIDVFAVPEPSSALLGCSGLLGLVLLRRR